MAINRQDQPLATTLTAREAMAFVAALRIRTAAAEERRTLVNAAIEELGLSAIADCLIGDRAAGRSGVSGGERKRIGLGTMLVSCPEVTRLITRLITRLPPII